MIKVLFLIFLLFLLVECNRKESCNIVLDTSIAKERSDISWIELFLYKREQ